MTLVRTDPSFSVIFTHILHRLALRIEFCRARARAHRWQEECLLLNEELARVYRFFGWDAARWEDRGRGYALRSTAPVVYTHHTHTQIQDRDHQNAMVLNTGKVPRHFWLGYFAPAASAKTVSLRVHQSRPGVPVIALGNFRFQN